MTASRKVATAKASGRPPHKAAGKSSTPRKMQKQAEVRVVRTKRVVPAPNPSVAPARPSKKAAVIALLARPDGAAISDLVGITGWQAHSVRARPDRPAQGRQRPRPCQGRHWGHALPPRQPSVT
jgi:hypothetical protein